MMTVMKRSNMMAVTKRSNMMAVTKRWNIGSYLALFKDLSIRSLETKSSQDLKSLTSLEYLCIAYLPQIQLLLEEGRLPSSLSELQLYYHHEFHSLGLWHLTSLLRVYTSLAALISNHFLNQHSPPPSPIKKDANLSQKSHSIELDSQALANLTHRDTCLHSPPWLHVIDEELYTAQKLSMYIRRRTM